MSVKHNFCLFTPVTQTQLVASASDIQWTSGYRPEKLIIHFEMPEPEDVSYRQTVHGPGQVMYVADPLPKHNKFLSVVILNV